MVHILKDFCITAIAKEKNRPTVLNALPRGRPTPVVNVAIETLLVITGIHDARDYIELFHLFYKPLTNFNFIKHTCFDFS